MNLGNSLKNNNDRFFESQFLTIHVYDMKLKYRSAVYKSP